MSDNPMIMILDRLEALDPKIGSVETKPGNLDAKIDNIDSTIGSVRGAVMARVDRLQDAMDRMRDDVTTNFFRADAVGRLTRDDRDEARTNSEVTMALTNQVNSHAACPDETLAAG